jgi:kynureninase
MIIEQQNSTAIITQDKTSLSQFIKKFSVLHERFKENNVILQLKDNATSSIDILVSISKIHRQLNQSFVVVSPQLNQNDFEDDFIVVPTLQEAHDYIEMELIQRDLGF